MKIKNKQFFIFFVFIFILQTNLNALFNLQKLTKSSNSGEFVILTSLQAKKEQLKESEKDLDILQKKLTNESKSIERNINIIQSNIEKLAQEIKTSPEDQTEYLKRKQTLTNEKQQTLINLQELWKTTKISNEKNVKIIKETIELQEKEEPQSLKPIYSWKEFRQIQEEVTQYITKIETAKTKKVNLNKQKLVEKENLSLIQSQIKTLNNQKKELEEIIKEEKEAIEKRKDLDLLEESIDLLKYKERYSNLKIENLNQLIKYQENKIENLQYKFNTTKNRMFQIEKRLVISQSDVELAKQEWNNDVQKAAAIKTQLNKQRNPLIISKEKLKQKLDLIQEEEKQLKEKNKETELALIEVKRQKIKEDINFVEKKLKIIDVKKSRLDAKLNTKKLQYEIINAYYQISLEQKAIESWLLELKNKKNLATTSIKEFYRHREEDFKSLRDIKRYLDHIKIKKEELKTKKDTNFKGKEKTYNQIILLFADIEKTLGDQQRLTQNNLAIISDIINLEEERINQYEFMIKDLESKYVAISIWKRSPKAISIYALQKSLAEAENFFQNLLWNIPSFFGLTSIFKSIQNLELPNYFGILLFIIFFMIAFLGFKKFIIFLKKKVQKKIIYAENHKTHIYFYNSAESILDFAQNNFKLLFSWFFVYLHILFNFKCIFSSISFISNTYTITIFYLVSIPILIYLSKNFIDAAKELNKKLRFLFFAEKTQSKFLFLITTILYATSILLPLRQAFLTYVDIPSEFPNVILAAYSLILSLAILLFFGKDDVLTLIPSKGGIFLWFKNIINKYYYPVFIFCMGLLILSNPYIGYSNLAWYLAFVIPITILLIYGLFFIHYYIRRYSMPFFLKEENEEIMDKFEQAKTYYGFFMMFSFLFLAFFTFIFIARIWKFDLTPSSLWQMLSKEWVIPVSAEAKLGIVQFLTIVIFLGIGFLISSLLKKFVFNKIFNILRMEPGTQDTIFKLTHYIIISISIILAFVSIHLEQFIFWVGGLLVLGVGFGLKDLITDFLAGFLVIIERPIEIGNFIQLEDGTLGIVQKISARATTIRTARNLSIIIPNKDFINKPIINWGKSRLSVGFELKIIVDYCQDFEKVEKVLRNTIEQHPHILRIPGVTTRLEKFENYGVQFFVRAFVSSRRVLDQWQIASEIRFAIIKAFRKNSITIAFPQTVVHVAQKCKLNHAETIKGIDVKFDTKITKEEE